MVEKTAKKITEEKLIHKVCIPFKLSNRGKHKPQILTPNNSVDEKIMYDVLVQTIGKARLWETELMKEAHRKICSESAATQHPQSKHKMRYHERNATENARTQGLATEAVSTIVERARKNEAI